MSSGVPSATLEQIRERGFFFTKERRRKLAFLRAVFEMYSLVKWKKSMSFILPRFFNSLEIYVQVSYHILTTSDLLVWTCFSLKYQSLEKRSDCSDYNVWQRKQAQSYNEIDIHSSCAKTKENGIRTLKITTVSLSLCLLPPLISGIFFWQPICFFFSPCDWSCFHPS